MQRYLIPDATPPAGLDQVAVIYETPAAREHLIRVGMQTGMFREADSTRQWRHADELDDGDFFEHAAQAELVIFVAAPNGDFTPELKQWIDRWLMKRQDREGAIVGIFHGLPPGGIAPRKEVYLRTIAHRAGLDYLSSLPEFHATCMPDSLDNFCERAGRMTSVLDQILHTRIPPHPGI